MQSQAKKKLVPWRVDEAKVTATVLKIEWERIYFHLYVKIGFAEDADRESPLDFYFVDQTVFNSGFKGNIVSCEKDVYHLMVNITNNGKGRSIQTGEYSLIVTQNGAQVAKARMSYDFARNVDTFDRNFLYSNNNRVFTISFVINGDDEMLPFYMRILTARKVGAGLAPKHVKQKKKIVLNPKTRFREWYNKNSKAYIVKFYHEMRAKREKDGKTHILFYTEQSDTMNSPNLIAVRDRMKARGMEKDFVFDEYALSFNTHPARGRKGWIDYLKKMAAADIIVMDDHSPTMDWLTLEPDTKVIQLWHAGAGFKSSGYSRWGHVGNPAPWSCHRQYSYGIAGSRKIAPFFSEVWGMNTSRVLPTGMPRIDQYLDETHRKETVEKLYEKYPAAKGKKVILFAPTYRGRNRSNAFYPMEMIDFDRLAEVCADEYIVFFKMHPWVLNKVPIPKKYKNKLFFDLTKYPNINDLFYITDILITDYSSSIFEYSLMHRPMLFFAYDEIQYSLSRGFHRPYKESAPGKVCHSFEELMQAIENKDFEYEKVEEYVKNSFDYVDTHASDRVIDWLILGNIPEDLQAAIDRDDAIGRELDTLDFITPEVADALRASEGKSLDPKDPLYVIRESRRQAGYSATGAGAARPDAADSTEDDSDEDDNAADSEYSGDD